MCAHSESVLTYLAGALLHLKEEGTELTPLVLFSEGLDELLQSVPGAVKQVINTVPWSYELGARVLKDCGPLAGRNWFIFVNRKGADEYEYGVFSYPRLPTALPLADAIAISTEIAGKATAVLMRKVGANRIEFLAACGERLELRFSTEKDTADDGTPGTPIFADACCSGITEAPKGFRNYVGRLIDQALTESHGTILVCAGDLSKSPIEEITDLVALPQRIDFLSDFSAYAKGESAQALAKLQSSEDLLYGFVRCDGMVLFDTLGGVTAYKGFFRPKADMPIPKGIVGGARRRAFEGLKLVINPELRCTLFRSQDGLTLVHGEPQ